MKNVYGEQPRDDNNMAVFTLGEGHVPYTVLISSLTLFFLVIIISLAISRHLTCTYLEIGRATHEIKQPKLMSCLSAKISGCTGSPVTASRPRLVLPKMTK